MILKTMKEFQKRKQIRLPDFDYSSPNAYFITVCTKNRQNLFWDQVGAVIGRPEDVRLSELGKTVEKSINDISAHYPAICVENYVVMPNHIHILLEILTDEGGRPMTAPTVQTVVNQMKGIVTKQTGFSVWQKGFYDHIIRGREDFLEIWKYIDGNPLKWAEDMQG